MPVVKQNSIGSRITGGTGICIISNPLKKSVSGETISMENRKRITVSTRIVKSHGNTKKNASFFRERRMPMPIPKSAPRSIMFAK